MSTVIDSIVTGKPAGPFAKMHNERSRELFMPFVVFSYPKWTDFEEVQEGLSVMCGHLLGSRKLKMLKATGTWEGEHEDSCVVFVNSASIMWGVIEAALTHYHQDAVITVNSDRQAGLVTHQGVTNKVKYIGIWESQGNKRPEGEDYTEVAGVYYTIRKRKGE